MLGSGSPTNIFPSVQPFPDPGGRCFPTELLHEIITLTLGQYLTDILVAPVSTRSWDAIGTLLHVNHHFRYFTLRVLNPLWDGYLVDRRSGHPLNYTRVLGDLRVLAEHAQTDPWGVLPPARYLRAMWRNITPYERLGRYFVVHLAQVNACLTADKPETQFELLDMSDLTQGFYALPNGLRYHMFGAFADYIVDNILASIRVVVFRTLVIEADELADAARFSKGDFSFHDERSRAESKLREARQCKQRMHEIAKSFGREKYDSECAVLSRDPISRDSFAKLLPKIRRAQTQGSSSEVICNMWMSALGVLLTAEERRTYGIPSQVD